ncbi:hypothetical protein V6N13_037686 [Hibiscus sabdariffa]
MIFLTASLSVAGIPGFMSTASLGLSFKNVCIDLWPLRIGFLFFLEYKAIGYSLGHWQTDRRTSSQKRLSELQAFLDYCMQGSLTDTAKATFLEAKREHKSLIDKEEAYWA